MFVNYFRDSERESPVNVAAARLLVGAYLAWNVASFDWGRLAEWNVDSSNAYALLRPPAEHVALPLEKWVLVASLVAFALGYRLWLSSFASALLLSHLGVVMYTYTGVGRTDAMFTSAYLLVFFGLYREQDVLTLDALRRGGTPSASELRESLRSKSSLSFDATALELSLLTVSILYFGSGVYKARVGPLSEWTTAWNLGRISIIVQEELGYTPLGRLLLEHPFALWSAAWGTLVFEVALLVVVLLGVTITPVVLGLFAIHAVIAVSLGPFFFDQYVLLLGFLSWESVHDYLARDRELTVAYDDRRAFCVRTVYPFAALDTKDALTLAPLSDAGDGGSDSDADPTSARDDPGPSPDGDGFAPSLYVSDGEETYTGFAAVEQLVGQYGTLRPLAWVLTLDPVERVGERYYRGRARRRRRPSAGSDFDD